MNIYCIVPLPCLKAAYSWRSLSSAPCLILSIRTLQKIFDGTDRTDIPQSCHRWLDPPFWGDFNNERSLLLRWSFLLNHDLIKELVKLLDGSFVYTSAFQR